MDDYYSCNSKCRAKDFGEWNLEKCTWFLMEGLFKKEEFRDGNF
ncbi:MAG: hypothetical protein Q8Q04_00615 [archaeon]|nr:hypothetical protein [archaeon]